MTSFEDFASLWSSNLSLRNSALRNLTIKRHSTGDDSVMTQHCSPPYTYIRVQKQFPSRSWWHQPLCPTVIQAPGCWHDAGDNNPAALIIQPMQQSALIIPNYYRARPVSLKHLSLNLLVFNKITLPAKGCN